MESDLIRLKGEKSKMEILNVSIGKMIKQIKNI